MSTRTIRVAMNGVTGRMGTNQHLVRSILAIRDQGGVELADGTRLIPEPVLLGRNAERVRELAESHGIESWSTDLAAVLADPTVEIYFDTQVTSAREPALAAAIAAGKHIYTEKPSAGSFEGALRQAADARAAGIKTGVVMDKLFLPGLIKLRRLVDSGFFGRILSVRGDFGYWVFDGETQPAQRPSWNYRLEDGGGIVLDMVPHWHYVLEHLFGAVRSVTATATTHLPTRWDEQGKPYDATADDAAWAIFELDGGIVAQINFSWCVRVRRDELLEFQVDGTHGSAVAGLRNCWVQPNVVTPKPLWNPDIEANHGFRDQWQEVPDNADFDNGFKVEWESFLRHVAEDEPFPWDFLAGARGVQLAELTLQSSAEGRRLQVPELTLP